MVWSNPTAASAVASVAPGWRSGRWLMWQATQVVVATVPAPWGKCPPTQFCVPPQAPVPGPTWQTAQSFPSPWVIPETLVT